MDFYPDRFKWDVVMLPATVSHDFYKAFVTDQLRVLYSDKILKLIPTDWTLIEKLWLTDLSATAEFLKDHYNRLGPRPTDPASLLRSFLLMLSTQRGYSITTRVDELRRVPLYAILSGFEPQNTPGIGTFYDFFRRLWASTSANSKPHKKFKRQKPKKGKGKGEKAPTTSTGKINKWVQRLLRYQKHGNFSPKPYDRLFFFRAGVFVCFDGQGTFRPAESSVDCRRWHAGCHGCAFAQQVSL